MSLINEALKKAQKQRTASQSGTTSPTGADSVARLRRGKPSELNTLLTRVGFVLLGLAAVIVAGVIFLRKEPTAPAAPVPATPVATSSVSTTAPATVAPPTAAGASNAPLTASTPNAQPPAASSPGPAFVVPSTTPAPLAPPAAQTDVAAAATPPADDAAAVTLEPPKSLPPPKMEGRYIDYILTIRVAMIRASGSDPKVLMNDRVYRVGDVVEYEMGLKLVGIASNALTFENDQGARYTRSF